MDKQNIYLEELVISKLVTMLCLLSQQALIYICQPIWQLGKLNLCVVSDRKYNKSTLSSWDSHHTFIYFPEFYQSNINGIKQVWAKPCTKIVGAIAKRCCILFVISI